MRRFLCVACCLAPWAALAQDNNAEAAARTIIQNAVATRSVSAADADKVMALVGPENQAALAKWAQVNGVQVMSEDGSASQVQSQNATYDPAQGAATVQNAQYTGRGYPASTGLPPAATLPARPPSYAPPPDVRANAAAQRQSPEEEARRVYLNARATRKAAEDAGPKPLTAVQDAKLRSDMAKDYKSAQLTIDVMTDPVTGVIALAGEVQRLTDEQKEAVTGWSGYVPSYRASSRTADLTIKNLKFKVTEMGIYVASLRGDIGQMAVHEWKIVSDMIASLDVEGMDARDLDRKMSIIYWRAIRAATVASDAYEAQYADDFDRYQGRYGKVSKI